MTNKFKPEMGKGDTGFTDLLGGRRVTKTDPRIKLNAMLDELGAVLGQIKITLKSRARIAALSEIQKNLITAAGSIAGMKTDMSGPAAALEARIKTGAAGLRLTKKFILPGSGRAETLLHLARTKARLCEILAWEIKAKSPAVYLNRLSDYLFLEALKSGRSRAR